MRAAALLALLMLSWPVPQSYPAAAVVRAVCTMHDNREFSGEKYAFAASDILYALVTLTRVAPGDHLLTTDWINPLGELERQDVFPFALEESQEDYRVYSWLQLLKKGRLSRAFTGREYDDRHYGQWRLNVYLDGQPVVVRMFSVL